MAVIALDPLSSRNLYVEALGLPLQGEGDGYHHSEQIAGCKSFGIWPFSCRSHVLRSRPVAHRTAGTAGQHRVDVANHRAIVMSHRNYDDKAVATPCPAPPRLRHEVTLES